MKIKNYFFAVIIIFLLIFSINFIIAKESKISKIENKIFEELSSNGKARVIVVLKDSKFSIQSGKEKRDFIIENIGKEKVRHKFDNLNAFSASLSAKDIEKLENDDNVERVYYDKPFKISLQDSLPLINATQTWAVQENGINLTGKGETICIIDTGIDYTHPDLGNCTPVKFTLNGTNESYVLESAHNYANNYDYTWNITKPGYSQIAVHFFNMSTEATYDYIYVLNGEKKIVAAYSGSREDFWSPSVDGEIIYVRLKTDESITDYGFKIDKVINGTTNTTYDWSNCSKIIGGWDAINYDSDPDDDNGHGTHVAGIAAANGTIKGVAPEAKIIAIKSLDAAGDGSTGDIAIGIEWCINRSSDFNISVISMSLGAGLNSSYCDTSEPILAPLINKAVGLGISVVIATGNGLNNDGIGRTGEISYPACIQNATPIGASTKADGIASYSNRNSIVQLFAPGSSINSTKNNGGYETLSGTSMATPHAAGAIAIINQFLKLQGNSKTTQEIESALNASGKIIADSGSGLNFSRINIYDAIAYLNNYYPEITVNSPVNNSWHNKGEFNVTIDEDGECWYSLNNGITNISMGSSDDRNFYAINTSLSAGAYNIIYYCNDSAGNINNSNIISFNIDLSSPNVSIISPSDGYSAVGTTSVPFQYNASDNLNISECYLVLNGAKTASNSSAVTNSTNTISYSVSAGTYTWSINCTDEAGNTGNSSSRSLIINSTPSRSSGGGGGGGFNTYFADKSSLTLGYTKELKLNDIIKFEFSENGAYKNHTIRLTKMGINFVNLTIQSTLIKTSLFIGEEKKFNLTSSEFYDLYVKLEEIIENKANLTIKLIYEKISREENRPAEIENITSEPYNFTSKIDEKIIEDKNTAKTNSYLIFGIICMIIVLACIVIILLNKIIQENNFKKRVKIK